MKNSLFVSLLVFSLLAISPCLASGRAGAAVPASQATFEKIVDQYYLIHEALANDTTAGVDAAARTIAALASEAAKKSPGKKPDFASIGRAATALQGKNLEQARNQFFELGKPIIAELKSNTAIHKSAFAYRCTMANKTWVQGKKEVRNPYYGKSMAKCGEPL